MPCPASGDGNRKWNVKWTLKKDDQKLEKKKSFKKVAHPECLPIYFQRKEKQCQVWRAVSSAARKFVVMDLSWVSESISACCTAVKICRKRRVQSSPEFDGAAFLLEKFLISSWLVKFEWLKIVQHPFALPVYEGKWPSWGMLKCIVKIWKWNSC